MKRLFFLMVVVICIATSATAQNPIKYQGEVDLGYSLGVGEFAAGRVNIHTIHGVKFGYYLSAGVGVGLDLYHQGDTGLMLPIYLNVKGYLRLYLGFLHMPHLILEVDLEHLRT